MVSQSAACDQKTHRRFFDPALLAGENDGLQVFDAKQCENLKSEIIGKYPPLAKAIQSDFTSQSKRLSLPSAVHSLLSIDKKLTLHDFNLLSDISDTSSFAQSKAEQCGRLIAKSATENEALELCAKVCALYQVDVPELSSCNRIKPILNRLSCHKWWKRQLSKRQRSTIESVARDLQQVHTHKSPYCSVISVKRFKQQKKNNRAFLESQIATNELGYEKSLAELSDRSTSNPALRRTEFIVRINGFELVAISMGHDGIFITLTAPSRFHRMTQIRHKETKKLTKVIPNPKYDGSSPRECQDYLVNLWAKIQAKLHRENIKPYGVRVAEPHHDGTPHWHFLLFVEPEKKQKMKDIFSKWAMQDSPEESGARKRRITFVDIKKGINPKTGKPYSATGYIIKYISKNIDGFGIDNTTAPQSSDWFNQEAGSNAEKIEAWARVNRIRQFQQIGGPSVTTWRELRRLDEQDGLLEEIRECAAKGDWASFVTAMGGPMVKRNKQAIKPVYALSEKLDQESGEIILNTETRYGDAAKERVVGVLLAGTITLSRTHFWTIKENETVVLARKQIMDGMVSLFEEIKKQNAGVSVNAGVLQSTKSAALDLFQ